MAGVIVCILLFISGFFILQWIARKLDIRKSWLWIVWCFKLVYTVSYVYVYSHFYGQTHSLIGDSYLFWEDSRILNEYAFENPQGYLSVLTGVHEENVFDSTSPLSKTQIWDYGDNGDWMNDNRLIIRINSVIHFFAFENVYVSALFFSLLSLIGLIWIFASFRNYIKADKLFFFTLCLLPSVGFFGSALTKEALLIFGIGMFIFSLKNLSKKKLLFFLMLAISAWILLFNKPYAGLIIIGLSPMLIFQFVKLNRYLILSFVSGGIILCMVILSYAPEKINLVQKISSRQQDMINLAKGGVFFVTDSSFCQFNYRYFENFDTIGTSKIKVLHSTEGEYKLFGQEEFHPFTIPPSDSLYDVYFIVAPSTSYFESTPISFEGINLVKTVPEVLLNTLIRPHPWDSGSNLKYFSTAQNWCFILFAIFVFLKRRKIETDYFFWFYYLLFCTILTLLLIGWTTPVFGAIARYKIPADIFLITCLFMLFNPIKSNEK